MLAIVLDVVIAVGAVLVIASVPFVVINGAIAPIVHVIRWYEQYNLVLLCGFYTTLKP